MIWKTIRFFLVSAIYLACLSLGGPALSAETSALSDSDAVNLIRRSGCMACHKVDKPALGPAYKDVAARYKAPDEQTKAYLKGKSPLEYLKHKVRAGTFKGGRNWVKSPEGRRYSVMTPNSERRISDEDLESLLKWILSQ